MPEQPSQARAPREDIESSRVLCERLRHDLSALDEDAWSGYLAREADLLDDGECLRTVAADTAAAATSGDVDAATLGARIALALVPYTSDCLSIAAACHAFGVYAAGIRHREAITVSTGPLLIATDLYTQAGLSAYAAECQSLCAECYRLRGRLRQSCHAAIRAHAGYEMLGDRAGVASSLLARSKTCPDTAGGATTQQELCYEALRHAPASRADLVTECYRGLGAASVSLGDHEGAERWLGIAIATAHHHGLPTQEALSRAVLGLVMLSTARPAESRRLCSAALSQLDFTQRGDTAAKCWEQLGDAYLLEGSIGDAEAAYCEGLDRAHSWGANSLVASLLGRLGRCALWRAEPAQAEMLCSLARARLRALGCPVTDTIGRVQSQIRRCNNPPRLAPSDSETGSAPDDGMRHYRSLLSSAEQAYDEGRWDAAAQPALEALSCFSEGGMNREAARCRQVLGRIAIAQGDLEAAEAWLRWALRSLDGVTDPKVEARCWLGLAHVAHVRGELERVEELSGLALRKAEAAGDQVGAADARLMLGRIRAAMGELGAAVAHYEQARDCLSSLPAERALGDALLLEAWLAVRARRFDVAVDLCVQSLEQSGATGRRAEVDECIALLAELACAQGDYAVAHRVFRGLASADDPPMMATARTSATCSAITAGRLCGVEAPADRMLTARAVEEESLHLGLSGLAATAAVEVSFAASELGQEEQARTASERAVAHWRADQFRPLPVAGRLLDGRGQMAVYEQAILAALRVDDVPRVYELAEEQRAQALMDAVVGARPPLRAHQLSSTRHPAAGASNLRGTNVSPPVARSAGSIQGATQQIVRDPNALDLAGVARGLTSGQALVHFWLGEDCGVSICLSRPGSGAPEVGCYGMQLDRETARDEVAGFRRVLGCHDQRLADVSEWAPLSVHLWSLVIAPWLAQAEGCEEVIVIPDGPLWLLPFESLMPSGDRPFSFLARRFALTYHFSASLACRAGPADEPDDAAPRYSPFLFGDPTVDPDLTPDQTSLPGAGSELGMVAEVWGVPPDDVCSGERATEHALMEGLQRTRFSHVATHYGPHQTLSPEWDLDYLMPGALLVSPTASSTPGRSTRPPYVAAAKLAELELHRSDLVVYSACDTGHGVEFLGEGVVGLAWATLYAGARAVVCSRWRLPDEVGTPELMQTFHTRLRTPGVGVAAALRGAQLELADSDSSLSHPRYWASCFFVGPRDLRLSEESA